MSKFEARKVRLLGWTGLALVLSGAAMSPALAQVSGTVDVSLQGTAASSPFLELGDGDGSSAVALGIRIEPSLVVLFDDVTSGSVQGNLAVEQFNSGYGTVASIGINTALQHRIDEKTAINAFASAQSSRSAIRDFLQTTNLSRDVFGSLNPSNQDGSNPGIADFGPDRLVGLDPNFLENLDPNALDAGQRGRTKTFGAGASLGRVLSSRDSISLGGSARFSQFEDEGAFDYYSLAMTASYRRALSERTGIQTNSVLERVDYEELSNGGDGLIFTPTVGIDHRLSENLAASIELGASFTDLEGPDGLTSKSVGFSGAISICHRQLTERLCAIASRGTRPTLFGGIANVTSAAVNYGRSLGPNDEITLSGQYSRNSASVAQPDQSFVNSASLLAVSASYNRRISQRLYAFVTPGYARTSRGASDNDRENYQIVGGVRYRFGKIR